MTTHDEIETRLLRALEVAPSHDGWTWLDQRVARALASTPAATGRSSASHRPLFLRPMVVLAAIVLLVGAVGAAITLIDRLVGTSQPGWRTAWERAEPLGIKQTDSGVTLTLERGYADLNQVLFGFSVDGLEAPPDQTDSAVLSWVIQLRGPDGWTPDPEAVDSSGRAIEADLSAFLVTFGSPPDVGGTWELTVTSVGYGAAASGMVDGVWQFSFELPDPAGVALSLDASDTVEQATLTLTELRVSPSAIGVTLGLDVSGDTVTAWGSGTGLADAVRHGDTSYEIADERLFAATPTMNEYRTSAGADDSAGTWTIEIPELWYTNDAGQDIHLDGPWTISVDAP